MQQKPVKFNNDCPFKAEDTNVAQTSTVEGVISRVKQRSLGFLTHHGLTSILTRKLRSSSLSQNVLRYILRDVGRSFKAGSRHIYEVWPKHRVLVLASARLPRLRIHAGLLVCSRLAAVEALYIRIVSATSKGQKCSRRPQPQAARERKKEKNNGKSFERCMNSV